MFKSRFEARLIPCLPFLPSFGFFCISSRSQVDPDWKRGLWFIFTLAFLSFSLTFAAEFRPISVWTPTECSEGHAAGLMIDGNPETTVIFLDDSRTGTKETTIPPKGSNPVTGSFVLDLGETRKFVGMKYVSPFFNAPRMPRVITVFTCDDEQGTQNVQNLVTGFRLLETRNGYSAFCWFGREVTARYVGVKIQDSWEADLGAGIPDSHRANQWINIRAVMAKKHMPVSGLGDQFLAEIAEVVFFTDRPSDLRAPNPPQIAYPEDRLLKDWLYQDFGLNVGNPFKTEAEKLAYVEKCRARRRERLAFLKGKMSQFLYVKHYVYGGGVIVEETELQTDRQPPAYGDITDEFRPGSQLCLATIHEDGSVTNELLLSKPNGGIRDLSLTYDAKTLYFSMREDFKTDNYHLYRMNMETRAVEQITFDLVGPDGKVWPVSDTEPCVTPEGKIVFSSTRGVLMDICWPMRTANLYTCDADGTHIRRLGFDQLHTMYPHILEDGRVAFTRWEYNDRNATFCQPVLTMNPDGTSQMEYYGGNSWYPTSILHTTGIPGSSKALAIISGHHVLQKGKLVLINPTKGTQENEGIEFVAGSSPNNEPGHAPSRAPQIDHEVHEIDVYGHDGPQWQYPFAFDETHYLTGFQPEGTFTQFPFMYPPFGIYFQDDLGNRELLAFDWSISCCQAIPFTPRKAPPIRATTCDPKQNWGQVYVQNVYMGPGLKGVEPGTIKRLRVVALEYRAARVGLASNRGPGGFGNVHTPISFNSGSWDVKHVLGEVPVEEDGSAYFEVPARTPVYFQLLDEKGQMVQTMRSWATLQGGELFACLGCHENKRDVGLVSQRQATLAMKRPISKLQTIDGKKHPFVEALETGSFLDSLPNYLGVSMTRSLDPDAPVEGFSYMQEIQPIWDQHCIRCHDGKEGSPQPTLTGEFISWKGKTHRPQDDHKRNYARSYLELTDFGNHHCSKWVSWIVSRSGSELQPPYSAGSTKSALMNYLEPTHEGVKLTDEEKRRVACWIDLCIPFAGSYGQHNTWTEAEKAEYEYFQTKRRISAQQEIDALKE